MCRRTSRRHGVSRKVFRFRQGLLTECLQPGRFCTPIGTSIPRILTSAFVYCLALTISESADAVVIATSNGLGADAEVRDHQPTTNFGASTELGTRIIDNFPLGDANDGNDRFSATHLKFDITGRGSLPNPTAAIRLTYRSPNLALNRIHDTTPPGNNADYRTGIAFYGLDRDHAGSNWSESTITYANAPGLANGGDFDNGTRISTS